MLHKPNNMIGIIITENNKEHNELSDLVGSIKTQSNYPTKWWGVERVVGGYQHRTDLHSQDGWKEVVYPTIAENQRQGNIYLDDTNDVFTYEVITKTDEEIKNEIGSQAESNKENFLTLKVRKQVEVELQALTDNTEILSNQVGYSTWDSFPDQYPFEADFKVQDFDDSLVLQVFKIITPHAKQFDRVPNETPALWFKIEYSGSIEIWSQPIGGDGKYPYLDPGTGNPYLVEHNGVVYENNFQSGLNVWEPGVYGWIIHV